MCPQRPETKGHPITYNVITSYPRIHSTLTTNSTPSRSSSAFVRSFMALYKCQDNYIHTQLLLSYTTAVVHQWRISTVDGHDFINQVPNSSVLSRTHEDHMTIFSHNTTTRQVVHNTCNPCCYYCKSKKNSPPPSCDSVHQHISHNNKNNSTTLANDPNPICPSHVLHTNSHIGHKKLILDIIIWDSEILHMRPCI